jgi:hypothetical protein
MVTGDGQHSGEDNCARARAFVPQHETTRIDSTLI